MLKKKTKDIVSRENYLKVREDLVEKQKESLEKMENSLSKSIEDNKQKDNMKNKEDSQMIINDQRFLRFAVDCDLVKYVCDSCELKFKNESEMTHHMKQIIKICCKYLMKI